MTDKLTFTITEEHLKLLSHMYVGWQDCEYGAPEIDPKRPYGNSFVEADIGEILEEEPEGNDGYEPVYSGCQRERFATLHMETQTALQICLKHLKFETGTYRRIDRYSDDWVKVQSGITFTMQKEVT